MFEIKLLNHYVSSINSDIAEKTGEFLTYPLHVLFGKNYQENLFIKIFEFKFDSTFEEYKKAKERSYSFGHKILAVSVLLLDILRN